MVLTSGVRRVATAGCAVMLLSLAGCADGVSGQGPGSPTESTRSAARPTPADEISGDNQAPDAFGTGFSGAQTSGGNVMAQVTALQCGERIDRLSGSPNGLILTGEFPPTVHRGADPMFAGTITISSSGAAVVGVTGPEADVYLVKAGVVVATPVAKDMIGQPIAITADGGATMPASGTLQSCAAGAAELPPGGYDIHAVVVVNQDDGTQVVGTGGPWPLVVT